MKAFPNTYATEKPEPVRIDSYSVWVSTNVRQSDGVWCFDLIQYTKDEYIKMMDERSEQLETQLTDTQLALCDVYEMIGG